MNRSEESLYELDINSEEVTMKAKVKPKPKPTTIIRKFPETKTTKINKNIFYKINT